MEGFKITIREPGSALTHFAAMILTMIGSVPLLTKTALRLGTGDFIAMKVFVAGMILLYAASATYHTVTLSPDRLRIFRKLDHMMIFVLIAGSYTPICVTILGGESGTILLRIVWLISFAGMLVNALWITCPKWLSSTIYIALGWACAWVFGELWVKLPFSGFFWLLIGGLIYTAGGVLYALKLKAFNTKHKYFGSHEIFHLFVMGGSFCHFIFMYFYVA